MKICRAGCTRTVFLIGKYAIKIPTIEGGWKGFIKGLLANMQEVSFSKLKDERMCPIWFYIPGGWMLIMPRCKEITREEFFNLTIDNYWKVSNVKEFLGDTIWYGDGEFKIPVEHKEDSFGWYNGNIVAIDYGN